MGSWPLNVIKNEYPNWKQRIENQQGAEGYTPHELSGTTYSNSAPNTTYHFEGGISVSNSNGKGYNKGKSETVKYSASTLYTVSLPEGMKVGKVQFYGYDNYDEDAYIAAFNGNDYSATDYVFPAKNGDEMSYVSHTLTPASPIEGSFTFKLGKKQCCLIITVYEINNASGIQEVEHALSDNAKVYCLQGIQVTNPTKGIYIQNDKKYVVR